MGTATLPNYQTKDFPQLSKKKTKTKQKLKPWTSACFTFRSSQGSAGICTWSWEHLQAQQVGARSPGRAQLLGWRGGVPAHLGIHPLNAWLCAVAQPHRALLVPSPADGNVDGFDFLAIVTSAAASPLVGMNFSSVASGTRLAWTYIKLMFNIFRSCFRGG